MIESREETTKKAPKRSRRTRVKHKKGKQQEPLHRLNNAKQGKKQSKNVKFPHFRYYKKSGHPALIEGEQVDEKKREEWIYRKTGHNLENERGGYEVVEPNPDKNDKRPMHISKRKRHDLKKNFETKILPWRMPKPKK